MEAIARVKKKDSAVKERKAAVEQARADVEAREGEGAEAEKERGRIEKRRDKELAKGGKLKALEEELNGFVKELARLGTQAELKEGTIKDEEKKVKGLEQASTEVRIALPLIGSMTALTMTVVLTTLPYSSTPPSKRSVVTSTN